MTEERQTNDEGSFVCNWCGVSFSHTPKRTGIRSKTYCSSSCAYVPGLPLYVLFIIAYPIWFLGTFMMYPEIVTGSLFRIVFHSLLLLFAFLFALYTIKLWKFSGQVPRWSRRGQSSN